MLSYLLAVRWIVMFFGAGEQGVVDLVFTMGCYHAVSLSLNAFQVYLIGASSSPSSSGVVHNSDRNYKFKFPPCQLFSSGPLLLFCSPAFIWCFFFFLDDRILARMVLQCFSLAL